MAEQGSGSGRRSRQSPSKGERQVLDLTPLDAVIAARDGRPGDLISRLRDPSITLSTWEREFLADHLEGKPTKPAHRPPIDEELRDAVALSVLHRHHVDGVKMEAAVADAMRESERKRSTIYDYVRQLRDSPKATVQAERWAILSIGFINKVLRRPKN